MFFTDYVVVDKATSTVDPLGFQRPASTVADNLYKQFTVLSNHPAYHGFLCFAFALFAESGLTPAARDFPRRFRQLETLWGILNMQTDTSILNVNKYRKLDIQGISRLSDLKGYCSLMEERLYYGTLGHYFRPSVTWELLDRKGMRLTARGEALAKGWRRREGVDFGALAGDWLADKPVVGTAAFEKAVPLFSLDSTPDNQEKVAWRSVIEALCIKEPIIAPLWRSPLPPQILDLASDAASYRDFFSSMLKHFEMHPDLCRRVELCQRFELLAGLVQFVFEWEYVRRLDEAREIGVEYPAVQETVAAEVHRQALELMGDARQTSSFWKPFHPLAGLSAYADQAAAILGHHAAHQKSKSAAAYLDGEAVVVRDKVKVQQFAGLLGAIANNPADLNRQIAWHYRRDWHFGRAARWIEYAGGTT